MIAFLILQLTLFFFSLLRRGLFDVTIFALVGFCATLFLVVVQASFRWFRGLAPISYRVSQRRDMDETDLHEPHLPPTAEDLMLAESNETYHAGVRYAAWLFLLFSFVPSFSLFIGLANA